LSTSWLETLRSTDDGCALILHRRVLINNLYLGCWMIRGEPQIRDGGIINRAGVPSV
jgi:hypothetical protein